MSKYYVKFKLEVREVDSKTEQIKEQGILYEAADTVTAHPDLYIKKALKEQAGKLAKTFTAPKESV